MQGRFLFDSALRDLQQSQAHPVLAPHWQEHSRVHTAQEEHPELHTCTRTCTAHSMSPYHNSVEDSMKFVARLMQKQSI